jgi:hypothetical protein
VKEIQAAAVDRALSTADPALARRHLRLVAALDGTETGDPLAVSLAATLAVAAGAPDSSAPATPPTLGGSVDESAVRGGAVAVARFDRSLGTVAASADLPRAAV